MDTTEPLYAVVTAFNDATCILAAGNSPLRDRLKVALGEISGVELPDEPELAARIENLREALHTGLDAMSEDDLGTAATEFVGITVDVAGLLAAAEAKADAAHT